MSENFNHMSTTERSGTVLIGGIRTTRLSRKKLAELMVEDCLNARRDGSEPKLVFDTNGHAISLSALNSEYRASLDSADIIHADGEIVVRASKLLTTTPIVERSATTDFFHDAAAAAATHRLRFFLLGGTEEVSSACARITRELYPTLDIVGHQHGYFTATEEPAICELINQSNADVVWVGLGKPREQIFCARNRSELKAGWLITCGGCFNYVTGHYKRAPTWMQNAGLEWLHRMANNPRQLFWRYLLTNPHALYLIASRSREIQD